jgi:4-hydroxythreonine-4-phosphate dehydrogenase
MSVRPLIGIPLGDPAGIGPEIVARTLGEDVVSHACRAVAIGDRELVGRALERVGSKATVRAVATPADGDYRSGVVNVVQVDVDALGEVVPGQVQASCGRAAYAFIERAVQLATAGQLDGLATAPINKQSLRAAGVPQIGHTEILAELTGAADPLTMFEVQALRIFFLTRHVSLRQACDLVSHERLLDYIERCQQALRRLGVMGSIAVAGLNPHCGDGGLLGREELDVVEPAVAEARRRGFDVEGPVAADSVFHQAAQGRYAAVLSLYHDQGHIAAKTMDFERTVSITHGLPFLRTSVDHGTAFDIAGKGLASPVSMLEAVLVAARYCSRIRSGSPTRG